MLLSDHAQNQMHRPLLRGSSAFSASFFKLSILMRYARGTADHSCLADLASDDHIRLLGQVRFSFFEFFLVFCFERLFVFPPIATHLILVSHNSRLLQCFFVFLFLRDYLVKIASVRIRTNSGGSQPVDVQKSSSVVDFVAPQSSNRP